MEPGRYAQWLLEQETRALLSRLARVRPFALQETRVPAASPSYAAQEAIEAFLVRGRRELREQARRFLAWIASPEGHAAPPDRAHRRYVFLRLRFNAVLSQFDIFSEAMSQRSVCETGIWLAGLDAVARDALDLPGYLVPPPVICYLARGPGGAIRRARTRLPGGGENPVAMIRLPRERMIGSGLASSLVHEVGHQGAALLGLVESLRTAIGEAARRPGREGFAWRTWGRWLPEIVADLWAIARVGIVSTLGLIGVVSLPRAFVFRANLDDPHPMPWMRVRLSAALGEALYPHPQWGRVLAVWDSFYPRPGLDAVHAAFLDLLEETLPRLVEVLVRHRPPLLRGRTLAEAMGTEGRQPARLLATFKGWRAAPVRMRGAPPALAFAVIGQARADGILGPEEEGKILAGLLRYWALKCALRGSAICARSMEIAGVPGVA